MRVAARTVSDPRETVVRVTVSGLPDGTTVRLTASIDRGNVPSLADLAGRRLAVTPPHTGPGIFTRIVLRQAGLDVDRDVQTIVRWPGDYAMDLRRLREGTIDAAMVGDTMAPEALAAEYGWEVLAFVGDHFQIPTVGVAVDPTYIDPDGPAVQAVVRAHRRALQVIQKDPDTTVRYMQTFLGRHTEDEVRAHYEKFIAPYFSHRRPHRPRRRRSRAHRGRRRTRRPRHLHRSRVLPHRDHHTVDATRRTPPVAAPARQDPKNHERKRP